VGLAGMRFHDLRHLNVSLSLAAGVPLTTVSKRAGHASVSLTSQTYAHLLSGQDSAAAEALNGVLPGRQSG
jgi:integrase